MVSQTHKSIIFEEFDGFSGKPDLCTMINNDPSGDQLISEIEDKLLVRSFEEFMEKFAPEVYEVGTQDPDTGKFKFFYTTDRGKFADCPHFTIKIGDHAFYQMLAELYSKRGSVGKSNLRFDDKEIMEILTPKKELEEAREIRQKMDYNLKLFYEAKARGDKSEMNAARSKLAECRKKIGEYFSAPLNKLFPIIIEDINKKLELFNLVSDDKGNDTPKALPAYGILYLNEAGQIDILDKQKREAALKALPAASEEKGGALVVAGDNHPVQVTTLPANPANKVANPVPDERTLQNEISKVIVSDYEKTAPNQSEYIKNLFVATFAPLAENDKGAVALPDKKTLLDKKEMYENVYAETRQSFAKEMSRIVESILGVKTFFDHATLGGGDSSEIPEGVIIANCKASRLLKIRKKFADYMKHLGKDQSEARIWFAVLPNVLESPPATQTDSDDIDDPFSTFIEEENVAPVDEDYVSINSLKEFVKIMDDAGIMTVFNIRVNNGNTFADLSAAEVESKMKLFEQCNYKHAVYAYPNFTLIRERFLKPFEGQDNAIINLPGIFIDAAYPAAGLLIASQQAKILNARKLDYDKNSPCVSVDFENLQVKKKLPTKFNRESILRRREDLIKIINENMFGFAFSGDEVKDEDGTWKNSYVHCARTLAKTKKGIYKPIYQTLTEDYITQELNLLPSRRKSEVKRFIDNINQDCTNKNGQNRYAGCVNLLLRKDEELRLSDEDGKLKVLVHFAGGDSYVDFEVESD